MYQNFFEYQPFKGELTKRQSGVLISQGTGKAVAYALWSLQDWGEIFVNPQEELYEGMVIGINNKGHDLVVNGTREKKLTNMRSAGADAAIQLTPSREKTLEFALEFIESDELVENLVVVIEDAAQAIGSRDRGQTAGSTGHYGCLSFFPTKNLGAFGDGGMVLTNDEERIGRLKALRVHEAPRASDVTLVGGNFRLDALQAAVISVKLKYLDGWTDRRNENAATYNSLFKEAGLVGGEVTCPSVTCERHIFNQYVIRAKRRARKRARFLSF